MTLAEVSSRANHAVNLRNRLRPSFGFQAARQRIPAEAYAGVICQCAPSRTACVAITSRAAARNRRRLRGHLPKSKQTAAPASRKMRKTSSGRIGRSRAHCRRIAILSKSFAVSRARPGSSRQARARSRRDWSLADVERRCVNDCSYVRSSFFSGRSARSRLILFKTTATPATSRRSRSRAARSSSCFVVVLDLTTRTVTSQTLVRYSV